MSSPFTSSALIGALIDQHEYPVVDTGNLDTFAQEHETCVLFFTEDPARFPESKDVAVILPELVSEYAGRFDVAIVSPTAQRQLQARYGFSEWPALIFLRRGRFLGTICRVQNWSDYVEQINHILESEPRANPGIGVPITQATEAST